MENDAVQRAAELGVGERDGSLTDPCLCCARLANQRVVTSPDGVELGLRDSVLLQKLRRAIEVQLCVRRCCPGIVPGATQLVELGRVVGPANRGQDFPAANDIAGLDQPSNAALLGHDGDRADVTAHLERKCHLRLGLEAAAVPHSTLRPGGCDTLHTHRQKRPLVRGRAMACRQRGEREKEQAQATRESESLHLPPPMPVKRGTEHLSVRHGRRRTSPIGRPCASPLGS